MTVLDCIRKSLHSTMFSINQSCTPLSCGSVPSLHSTMFPINPITISQTGKQLLLYIPLCFLLIPYCPHGFRLYFLSLHSTMFPINLEFSFHIFDAEDLYIPLCFLLITREEFNALLAKFFTFHYVSY